MIRGKSVTLVIPCKNEEVAIAGLLSNLPPFIDEVIVVDNNSTDRTRQVAKKLGARVLTERRHKNGIGYGYAHQRGLQASKGDITVTLDGDGTYPLDQIKPAIKYLLENKLDMVSCNRFPLYDSQAISWIRQLGVWILNNEVRLLYGYPIKDILSGMWLHNQTAAKSFKLESGGWNLSPEIKLQAIVNPSLRFGEFHIRHSYRHGGLSKQQIWVTGFDHLFYILGRKLTWDNPLLKKLKTVPTLGAALPKLSFVSLNQ